jgi:chemotaxis protein MotB
MMMTPRILRASRYALLAALGPTSAACVSQDRYDAAVKDAQQVRAGLEACSADVQKARAEAAGLNDALARVNDALAQAQAALAQSKKSLDDANGTAASLQAKVDNAIAENAQLKKELERLGKNADKLLAEKGGLASALADAKARLEELRKAQAAAAARAQLYKEVLAKFQKMIDAGELRIALRNGRMVIQLQNDVLFDSGHTELKPAGQQAIAQVAAIFRTIPDRKFQVAGDTDTVPIHTERYPSNWELSTARAVEVVRFLIAKGLRPEELSAAGYGEFDPVAPNDDAAGRARNRRIEITLQPNIDELVTVPPT